MIAVRSGNTLAARSRKVSGVSGWIVRRLAVEIGVVRAEPLWRAASAWRCARTGRSRVRRRRARRRFARATASGDGASAWALSWPRSSSCARSALAAFFAALGLGGLCRLLSCLALGHVPSHERFRATRNARECAIKRQARMDAALRIARKAAPKGNCDVRAAAAEAARASLRRLYAWMMSNAQGRACLGGAGRVCLRGSVVLPDSRRT